ncbi:MAG: TonB-dependent receptor, partial [Bacteroidota bacterium]
RNFGLFASRDALGNLGPINRTDPGGDRDLQAAVFANLGNETRLLHKYNLLGQPSALLLGARYYVGQTQMQQGDANDSDGPDFAFINPGGPEISDFDFPSRNASFFAEQVINFSPKFSATPGFRFEYIRTGSQGWYTERAFDLAGNLIFEQTNFDTISKTRVFPLAGLGLSFKPKPELEAYANISQNYRAITFTDLRVENPNFRVDENLTDERGYNADLGVRGAVGDWLNFDMSLFFLQYRQRIGQVLQVDSVTWQLYRFRTNIADAQNFGLEWYAEADLWRVFSGAPSKTRLGLFTNVALIDAVYVDSEQTAFDGKKVEMVPPLTVKAGLNFRHEAFKATAQWSYTGEHFSDATNAVTTPTAVEGLIPSYQVVDLSFSYEWKLLQFETGVNNLLNELYFTRRASGYPGPGIIPSSGRSFYFTLQVKI